MIEKQRAFFKKYRKTIIAVFIVLVMIIGINFAIEYEGFFKQKFIVCSVNKNAVFEQPDSRKEWYEYYKKNNFEMTKDNGKKLDGRKVNEALQKVNKHSSVLTKSAAEKYKEDDKKDSGMKIEDHFADIETTYIKLNTRLEEGLDGENDDYISKIVGAVEEADPKKGIVLDLRDNLGGKTSPIIIGFGGFLPINEPLLYIVEGPNEKEKSMELVYKEGFIGDPYYRLSNEYMRYSHEIKKIDHTKIAVLIGPDTASAAEFSTLALMTNEKQVRVFGEESGGYTSKNGGNLRCVMPNSNLTIGWIKTINGKMYRNDPIEPQIKGVESKKLKEWLYSN